MNKPFCRKSFETNNEKGIKASMSLLNQHGLETRDTTEAYSSHDFIVGLKSLELKVEAEVSNVWRESFWPYDEVTVPHRKRRSKADIFVMINKTGDAAIVADMDLVKASPVREKFVFSTKMNEPFFWVPVEHFDLYVRGTDGVWREKKMQGGIIGRHISSVHPGQTSEAV